MPLSAPGLIVAAPASGSGKTVVTLALLRHFRNAGVRVASFKVGPDYIDPAFHGPASGRPCVNLDPWAMRPELLARLAAGVARDAELVIGEGVMGLFDGAPDGTGSTADLAALTGWPVLLVVDVRGQVESAAALLHGFASFRSDVRVAGVLFNRVGGASHVQSLREACAGLDIPVMGAIPRLPALALPERHLGLVQAAEHADLERFLDGAANVLAEHCDGAAIHALAAPAELAAGKSAAPLPPLGQRLAVARDEAFAFAYPFILDGWSGAGVEVVPFSPLADEAPDRSADAVYLPGGYPELHAGRIAANGAFLRGLRAAAGRGAAIYGECGGYMVLGEALIDAEGTRHGMAGVLPLETSFAERRLHLGYRDVTLDATGPLGPRGGAYRGHEFHYATVCREETDPPLFVCRDGRGALLGGAGSRRGCVMGSFIHLVDHVR